MCFTWLSDIHLVVYQFDFASKIVFISDDETQLMEEKAMKKQRKQLSSSSVASKYKQPKNIINCETSSGSSSTKGKIKKRKMKVGKMRAVPKGGFKPSFVAPTSTSQKKAATFAHDREIADDKDGDEYQNCSQVLFPSQELTLASINNVDDEAEMENFDPPGLFSS